MSRGTEAGEDFLRRSNGKNFLRRDKGKNSCRRLPGGEKREKSVNNCGRVAFLLFVRFGKLAKSRAMDGCTPAPFLRWYNVSRGT